MKKFLLFFIFALILPFTASAASKEDAVLAIENIEIKILQMQQDNLETTAVNDSLTEAKLALERADFAQLVSTNATGALADAARKAIAGLDEKDISYGGVILRVNDITIMIEKAYSVADIVKHIESELENPEVPGMENSITGMLFYPIQSRIEVDLSDVQEKLPEAKTALAEGRYSDAEKIALGMHDEMNKKQGTAALAEVVKFAGRNFFVKNMPSIIFIAVFLSVSGVFVQKKRSIRKKKAKLRKLKIEEKTLVTSMKKTQVLRYKEGKIPDYVYKARMSIYQHKLNEVKKEIPAIKEMLKKGRV